MHNVVRVRSPLSTRASVVDHHSENLARELPPSPSGCLVGGGGSDGVPYVVVGRNVKSDRDKDVDGSRRMEERYVHFTSLFLITVSSSLSIFCILLPNSNVFSPSKHTERKILRKLPDNMKSG